MTNEKKGHRIDQVDQVDGLGMPKKGVGRHPESYEVRLVLRTHTTNSALGVNPAV